MAAGQDSAGWLLPGDAGQPGAQPRGLRLETGRQLHN